MFSKCSFLGELFLEWQLSAGFSSVGLHAHLPAMLLLLLRPLLSLAASLLPFVYGTSSET